MISWSSMVGHILSHSTEENSANTDCILVDFSFQCIDVTFGQILWHTLRIRKLADDMFILRRKLMGSTQGTRRP